jgi:hypothetical protein
MIFFQQDECFNDRRLPNRCNPAGKCIVRKWPEEREGQRDDVWLPELLRADAPILTTDFAIVLEEQNRRAVPIPNTGIIVPKPESRRGKFFGSREAMEIIELFKKAYGDWHLIDWSNVYIELGETGVYICDFYDKTLTAGERIEYADQAFALRVNRSIATAKKFGYSRRMIEDDRARK